MAASGTPKTTDKSDAPTNRRGIQSIEIGFRILDVIRKAGTPVALKDLAEACSLSVPNVHYYLVSFQKVGIVQQHADTGFYALGSYALRLGLAALEQFDVFTAARPSMADLASITGQTVFLGVWGNKGPTIVYRVEGGNSRPLLELRVGSVLPLLSSALGRNFLAHLPKTATQELLEKELREAAGAYTTADIEHICKEVHQFHISRCRDSLLPHFVSLSAPIFNMLGEMTAAITLMGPAGSLDDNPKSETAQLIIRKARSISAAAGWLEA